jgi:hypothetical protein
MDAKVKLTTRNAAHRKSDENKHSNTKKKKNALPVLKVKSVLF